jgi:hypothetical protein
VGKGRHDRRDQYFLLDEQFKHLSEHLGAGIAPEHAVWADMHQHFANDPDMEQILLDSTIVRALPCPAGASKKAVGKKIRRTGAAGAGSAPKSTPV